MRDACCVVVLTCVLLIAALADSGEVQRVDSARYRELAKEMEDNLRTHVLAPWFPRAVDKELGGFRQGFGEDWNPTGTGRERSIVYQSRLTWVASQIALRSPNLGPEYLGYVNHGLDGLEKLLWDAEKGGFYWQVDAQTRKADREGEKHAYGISFGIYAAAAAYRATREPRALALAKRAFDWLDKHAHDGKNGGYYEALRRDGKPIMAPSAAGANDFIGTRYGFKSMNSHIHLLEAFTELYRVWPDDRVGARLLEVFTILRDKVYVDPGCLHLFFNPNWRPVPDHDSFGHDVETAYLLVEAAERLNSRKDPTFKSIGAKAYQEAKQHSETWRVARNLVDHALQFGWDERNSGFYDRGSAFGPATHKEKVWWTQAEGLNALLVMHEHYGNEIPRYWQAFEKQWRFIREKQTDSKNMGWFPVVAEDGTRIPGREKSNAWTDPYHQGRALLNVTAALERLASDNRSSKK